MFHQSMFKVLPLLYYHAYLLLCEQIPIPLPETEVWANYNCGKIDLRTMAVDLMRLR